MAALAVLVGCAQPVIDAEPARSPDLYAGPLFLDPKDYRVAADREIGAAGRVVQCRTRITGAVDDPHGLHEGAPASSPRKALRVALGEGWFNGVSSRFRLDRQDPDRALFTYRVTGVVKQAIIVHHGPTVDRGGKVGWFVESWARCDLAEFDLEPPQLGGVVVHIWRDEHDGTVPTYEISSSPGPSHCDWEAMTFLHLRTDTFVANPLPEYVDDYFADPYRRNVPLPSDAVDTGYHGPAGSCRRLAPGG